jgi:hypothetical protein
MGQRVKVGVKWVLTRYELGRGVHTVVSETCTVTLLCTDFGNHGGNMLFPKFWSAVGICQICNSTDTGLPSSLSLIYSHYKVSWGYAVAQLVEALRYKPEGRGFDSRWGH